MTASAPNIGFADGATKGLLFGALAFAVIAVIASGALSRGGGRSSSAADFRTERATQPVYQQAPQPVQPTQQTAAPRSVAPVSSGGIPAQAPPDLDAPIHGDGGIPGLAPAPEPLNDGGIPAPAPADLDDPIIRDAGIPAPPPTR